MKNSITVKFIAVVLCAAALLGVVGSGVCFLLLGSAGLMGSKTAAQLYEADNAWNREVAAEEIVRDWAATELGGMPQYVTDDRRDDMLSNFFTLGKVFYSIADAEGNVVSGNYDEEPVVKTYEIHLPVVTYEELVLPEEETATESASVTEDTAEEYTTEPRDAFVPETENVFSGGFYSQRLGRYYNYQYREALAKDYTVTLYMAEGAVQKNPAWMLLEQIWMHKRLLTQVLMGCAFVFAVAAVYLCCCAGHGKDSDQVKAAGLNAMPLDVYALGFLVYVALCTVIGDRFIKDVLAQSSTALIYCAGAMGFIGCLIFVGFCFAFVAQIKTGNHFWWYNSLIGRAVTLILRVLRKIWRGIVWLIPRIWKNGKRAVRAMLTVAAWLLSLSRQLIRKSGSGFRILTRWTSRKVEKILSRLPLTWQWMTGGVFMITLLAVTIRSNALVAGLGIIACLSLVLYGAGAFGTLMEGAQKMRSGDLETKIEDEFLVGSFKDFAEELNGLGDIAMLAAQKQLKSERMKTELITNVTHDIKTPLTSIINYVDLLSKPHTPEEEKAYVEVLARQSGRMKKLVEDLIEMSKATSGNIPVEITTVDAVEFVNQALGEFSDKLDAAALTPVFHSARETIPMLADAQLVWRSLSNVLSNAVKYAMPGTRIYLDVSEVNSTVVISVKNISSSALNVSADELLERFVRGDTSRNTEGSGLGLNITKCLMELQKGQLQLLVDGDLFKVTLVFPKA